MRQESLKKLTGEGEIQGPYKLPEGWRWVKLGDILIRKPQYGLTAISKKEKQEVRYIRISDVTDYGELKNDDQRFVDLEPEEYEKYKLEEGDILIARSGSVGRIYFHKNLSTRSVFASYFIRFKLDKTKVLPEFFFYYGLSPFYKNFINETLKIVAQPNINAKEYSKLPIPLPPLEEQKCIVARIEELFSKIDEMKKLRREALEQARALLSSALHQVFSMADEKGWRWVRLGEVCKVFSGSSAPQGEKYFENGKYPFVRVQDLGKYGKTTNLIEVKDYVNDLAINKFRLVKASKGTILFPKSGAAVMTNNRAILGLDAFIVSHLAAIKPYVNHIIPEFIYYWLCQVDMGSYIENPAYPSLKLSTIKNIPIPLPPLEEQKRIVAYLDKIQERVQALQKLQEETEKDIEKLKEAILYRAFRGEL